eukprot:TRINITY_DN6932_c2_g2_i1.p1 TRINITY_DN6932_c2_g2~~TRINITY_DN6932_c2_g2_i1.p1  ORF type:complete len:157 (+),score=17.23 TRINITY_DN6932_c2_g2_i1:150-620(+)
MAGRFVMAQQSPPPDFVPPPRFESSSTHRRHGGSDETMNVSSRSTSRVPALQSSSGHSRRGGSHETINGSSSSTAAVPALSYSPMILPRSFLAALHMQGRCLPCRYHKHPDGCKKGATCNYCHHPHDDWSLPRTQKYFRKHIGEYSEEHGLHASEP